LFQQSSGLIQSNALASAQYDPRNDISQFEHFSVGAIVLVYDNGGVSQTFSESVLTTLGYPEVVEVNYKHAVVANRVYCALELYLEQLLDDDVEVEHEMEYAEHKFKHIDFFFVIFNIRLLII
jgi:hypothetical protein